MTNSIRQLRAKGYTIKEIARLTNASIATVQRSLEDYHIVDYSKDLVSQCVQDLKIGAVCYCFNLAQLYSIAKAFKHFTYTYNGVGYTLTPDARGYHKMRALINNART